MDYINSQSDKSHPSEEVVKYCFGVSVEQLGAGVLFIRRKDRLSEYATLLDNVEEFKGKIWFGLRGSLGDERVSVVVSGVGPSSTGDCVYALKGANIVALYSGTCGGIGTQIGDFIIGERCVCGDGFSQQLGYDFESTVEGDEDCLGSVAGCLEKTGRKVLKGKIYTTASFIAENDPSFQERPALNGCIGIDMEAAAFYAACQRGRIPGAAYFWVTDLPFEGKSFYFGPSLDDIKKKQEVYDMIPAMDLEVLKNLVLKNK